MSLIFAYEELNKLYESHDKLTEASRENMRDIDSLILIGGGTDECVKLINDVRAEYPGIDNDELADILENMNDDLLAIEWISVIAYFDEAGWLEEEIDPDFSDDELANIYGGDTKNDTPDGLETPSETEKRFRKKSLADARRWEEHDMSTKVIYENDNYKVEYHPMAGRPYWLLDKSIINPLHPEMTFYDEERAIEWADIYNDRYGSDHLSEWVDSKGKPIQIASSTNTLSAPTANTNQTSQASASTGKNVVTIVYDNTKHKLRAQADDGVHGKGWVAFPSNLRNSAGQQYEVEELVWNGKNYRASGDIKPISGVSNTQSINETINKENYNMNFQNVFAELDKLYEELPAKEAVKKESEEPTVEETEVVEALVEAAEDNDEEIEIVDDEAIEIEDDEAEAEESMTAEAQFVLECANCGALVIKTEGEVKTDEEADLANADEACQFCEEQKGYKVIGTFVPADDTIEIVDDEVDSESSEEPAEEAELEELFDANLSLSLDGGTGNDVKVL